MTHQSTHTDLPPEPEGIDKNRTPLVRHTPAPWTDNGSGLIYGQSVDDEAEAPFVSDVCRDGAGGIYVDQERANARLITAAPDLLEVAEDTDLDAAHDALSVLLEDELASNDDIREAAITLTDVLNEHQAKRRNAIAKARGREA